MDPSGCGTDFKTQVSATKLTTASYLSHNHDISTSSWNWILSILIFLAYPPMPLQGTAVVHPGHPLSNVARQRLRVLSDLSAYQDFLRSDLDTIRSRKGSARKPFGLLFELPPRSFSSPSIPCPQLHEEFGILSHIETLNPRGAARVFGTPTPTSGRPSSIFPTTLSGPGNRKRKAKESSPVRETSVLVVSNRPEDTGNFISDSDRECGCERFGDAISGVEIYRL